MIDVAETTEETTVETTDETTEETTEETTVDPDKWRETYVETRKGGDKMQKRLERYASQDAVTDALISVQNRISAGELRSSLPKDAKEEEIVKWRAENGIPEKSNGYEIKLKSGVVPGEEDKELVDAFLESAHTSNMNSGQVNSALDWYYDVKERVTQARSEEDEKVAEEVQDLLRVEWGGDYRANKAKIEAFLDTGPAGIKDAFFEARMPDGTLLASDVDTLRFWVDKARELNPTITIVPGEGAEQEQGIENEKKELMRQAGAPKGTKEHDAYWKQGGEARYKKLVEAGKSIAERKRKAG